MTKCRSTLQRGAGFTLIELLVVISILALLIALLLPAIKRARVSARVVACSTNIRQIMVAIHSYAGDNDDEAPGYNHGKYWTYPNGPSNCPRTNESNRVAWNIIFIGGETHENLRPDPVPSNPRKLNEYMSAIDGFRCPSDIPTENWSNSNSWFEDVGNSYFYNSNWFNGPQNFWVFYGSKLGDFDNPSKQVLAGDPTISYAWAYGAWFPLGPHIMWGYQPYHDRPENHAEANQQFFEGSFHQVYVYDPKCNVGFLDGHVSFIKLGPYDHPGDTRVNTSNYILDPNGESVS